MPRFEYVQEQVISQHRENTSRKLEGNHRGKTILISDMRHIL